MKRAEISQVFIYMTAIIIVGMIFLFGFYMINSLMDAQCKISQKNFHDNVISDIKSSVDFGDSVVKTYQVPCDTIAVCFGNRNASIDSMDDAIYKSLKDKVLISSTSSNNNFFMVLKNGVESYDITHIDEETREIESYLKTEKSIKCFKLILLNNFLD